MFIFERDADNTKLEIVKYIGERDVTSYDFNY